MYLEAELGAPFLFVVEMARQSFGIELLELVQSRANQGLPAMADECFRRAIGEHAPVFVVGVAVAGEPQDTVRRGLDQRPDEMLAVRQLDLRLALFRNVAADDDHADILPAARR